MRRPTAEEMANAFLWAAVILATAILLRGTQYFWTRMIILAPCAWASMMIVTRLCRRSG